MSVCAGLIPKNTCNCAVQESGMGSVQEAQREEKIKEKMDQLFHTKHFNAFSNLISKKASQKERFSFLSDMNMSLAKFNLLTQGDDDTSKQIRVDIANIKSTQNLTHMMIISVAIVSFAVRYAFTDFVS